MKTVLVTGAAGFIGFHVSQRLLRDGHTVVGLDNLNNYYSVELKQARLKQLEQHARFEFHTLDLAGRADMAAFFEHSRFDQVVHLAAQAGVRYSLTNPHAYIDSNLVGFANLLEGCHHHKIEHLVFASSSSVYGANRKVPFQIDDRVDHPVSLYAATKKANELMAYTYSHLYAIPVTGLRFFTVYGPWGRPDMAVYRFTEAMLAGRPIDVYNRGEMRRDFTYVDDIVEGVVRVLDKVPRAEAVMQGAGNDPPSPAAPYRLYNIGNSQPVNLMTFIKTLEKRLGVEAKLNLMPMQPGDVLETYADIEDLMRDVGFRPATSLEDGLRRFVAWYRGYHGL